MSSVTSLCDHLLTLGNDAVAFCSLSLFQMVLWTLCCADSTQLLPDGWKKNQWIRYKQRCALRAQWYHKLVKVEAKGLTAKVGMCLRPMAFFLLPHPATQLHLTLLFKLLHMGYLAILTTVRILTDQYLFHFEDFYPAFFPTKEGEKADYKS